MNAEKEKQNVRILLFADFSVTPEKALQYLNDMAAHPQKVTRYNHLLMQNLSRQESIKEKTREELNRMAHERVETWNRIIGPVSTQEYVMMSKQWDIPIDSIIDKRITPDLIKNMLDFFVMGQDSYKKKLAVAFFIYLIHSRQGGLMLPKSNLLVCGPSGSGKTYGMQALSALFHIPFIIIHCNSLVQEGIIGPGLTDGFTSLLSQGWTKEEIARAVICFDEFDKLFEKRRDAGYYNARIINEMLNIIDDKGEVEFKSTFINNGGERIRLSTRKMMFVFTGVFDGLRSEPAARRRIGFDAAAEIDDEPTMEDFVKFGIKPEIMGRIQNYVFLEALTEKELVALFDQGAYSPFSEFEQYFSYNGIDAVMTEDGKQTLAQLAIERKLGVRGLKSLLQEVLMDDMYFLKQAEDNTLMVTRQYIMNNLNNQDNG